MSTGFDRASERLNIAKPFAFSSEEISGTSNAEKFNRYQEYKDANAAYRNCQLYATSYAAVMMQRTITEEPDFLEERGTTKEEFLAHIQNNLCLGLTKYRSSVFKQTAANIQEDGYVNDKVRRLVNGGDKFHPYI